MPITTELDAVNILLSAIGASPVTHTEALQNADAQIAKNHIDRARREIQAEQWYFNTEENYPLTPTATGEILIEKTITNIDQIGQFGTNANLVIREGKLYDRVRHTYKIGETIYANITLCLDFTDLTETAAQYVIARAARKYQEEMLGDPSLRTWTKEDEAQARGRLIDEDLRVRKPHFGILPRLDPNVGIDMRNI